MLRAAWTYSGGGIAESLGSAFIPIYAVDNEPSAALTFKTNHPRAVVRVADASKAATIKDALSKVGEVDAVFSSAPCQDFSTAHPCERQRSARNALYVHAVEWVRAFKPRAFVAENVPSVAKSLQFRVAVNRLRGLGYAVTAWTLDAKKYGAPQTRRRTFLVAVAPGFRIPERPTETHGPGLAPFATVRDAWSGLDDPLADGVQRISQRWRWLLEGIKAEQNWRCLLGASEPEARERLEYVRGCFPDRRPPKIAARRLRTDRPSPCLRTSPAIQQMMLAIHPSEPRLISVREYRRLFGIPDSWRLPVREILARYRIIGNGICPHIWSAVCASVASALRGEPSRYQTIQGDALAVIRKATLC